MFRAPSRVPPRRTTLFYFLLLLLFFLFRSADYCLSRIIFHSTFVFPTGRETRSVSLYFSFFFARAMSQNRVLPSSVTAIPVEEVEDISCPEICPFLSPFRALFSSSSFVPFRIFHRSPLSIVLSHSHLSSRNYLSLSLNSFYPLYQQNANTR